MNKYENYDEKEDVKDLNARQLLDRHKNELKAQDEDLKECIGVARQGNKLATNIGDEFANQNKKLELLETDIEKTEQKMVRTRGKFDEFIEKSNFCCLYIIILLEIIGLILVIFMV